MGSRAAAGMVLTFMNVPKVEVAQIEVAQIHSVLTKGMGTWAFAAKTGVMDTTQ